MNPIILSLAIAILAGAAALGYVAVADRSGPPHWVPTSWSEAASRFGLSNSPAPAPVSSAEIKGYAFQLVQQQIKQGDAVAVRLVHEPTGEAVPGAVVFARRIDMEPEGRSEEHTSELQSLMRISYAVFCLKKQNKI